MKKPMIAAIFDLDSTLYTGYIPKSIAYHHRVHRVKRLPLAFYVAAMVVRPDIRDDDARVCVPVTWAVDTSGGGYGLYLDRQTVRAAPGACRCAGTSAGSPGSRTPGNHRLTHHAHIIEFRGESYRLRERLQHEPPTLGATTPPLPFYEAQPVALFDHQT